jgi:DNA-binding response OmpR family regulator
VKILVVDDDADLRSLVGYALTHAGYLVLEAESSAAALRSVNDERPSLIVLDLNLGREDGLDLLPRIREVSKAPVLVLTVRSGEEDVVRGLDLGADDYLTKPFSPRTLMARVRALLRRASGDGPAPELVAGDFTLDPERRSLTLRGRETVRLTPLELRLVQLLMARADEVVAAPRLIAHVWGARGGGDRQLLKQLVHRLRQKVEAEPAAPRRILAAPGEGYRLVSEMDGDGGAAGSSERGKG